MEITEIRGFDVRARRGDPPESGPKDCFAAPLHAMTRGRGPRVNLKISRSRPGGAGMNMERSSARWSVGVSSTFHGGIRKGDKKRFWMSLAVPEWEDCRDGLNTISERYFLAMAAG